jgi:uncharacterized membrane protein SpoIIM required for sporulation
VLKEFIDARTRQWRRLEELADSAQRDRLTTMTRSEVREMARLYRRTATDLAIAREEMDDPLLVNYLNALVGRAHGAIYRNEGSGFRPVLDFFRFEFPATFRRTFLYTLAAFALAVGFAGVGAAVTAVDERFADAVVGPKLREQVRNHEDWTLDLNDRSASGAAFIQQNNIMVCILAFGGGIFFGLGTVYILVFNGLMIGTVVALCVRYDFDAILIFMAGHGVLELSAIFISGGAGLLLGHALVAPGDLTRGEALVRNGRQSVVLMLGCAVMLIVAGLIEGFVSPALIDAKWKLAVSATSAVLLALYLLKPDRRPARAA